MVSLVAVVGGHHVAGPTLALIDTIVLSSPLIEPRVQVAVEDWQWIERNIFQLLLLAASLPSSTPRPLLPLESAIWLLHSQVDLDVFNA